MKRHTFLYELCEVTHIAQILESVILNIELELTNIGMYGGADATIILIDKPSELNSSDDVVKGLPKYGQIIVNIANIPLAKQEILNYIFRKFLFEELKVKTDAEAGSIEVSWKDALPVYAGSRDKADGIKSSDDTDSNNHIQDLPKDAEYKNIADKIHDEDMMEMIDKNISNLPVDEISSFLHSHLKYEKLSKVNIAIVNDTLDESSLYKPIKIDLYEYTVKVSCDVEYIGNWISDYFGSELASYSFKSVATAYDDNGKPGYVLYEVTLK